MAKAKTAEQQLERGQKLWQDLQQKAQVVEVWIAEAESIENDRSNLDQSISKHKVTLRAKTTEPHLQYA